MGCAVDVRLTDLLRRRDHDKKIQGGEFFTLWGVTISLGLILNAYVVPQPWIFAAFILGAAAVQEIYAAFMSRKERRHEAGTLRFQIEMRFLWFFLGAGAMPLVGFVFPFFFDLYGSGATFPLLSLMGATGMLATWLFTSSRLFLCSFAVFVLAMIIVLFIYEPYMQMWVFIGALTAGLTIPGIISKSRETMAKEKPAHG